MDETIDLATCSLETLDEIREQDRLDDLREQFWVLSLDPPNRESHRTGARISPVEPFLCDNCSCPTETVITSGETALVTAADSGSYCDGCWDDAHRRTD